jgi:adenine-specific DNA-methyltransferase
MTSALPAGHLTLSWVGKERALLGTADGGYEWVERDDPRVTEARLLRTRETVGDAAGAPDNLLVVGDAYDALHALATVPEYAGRFRAQVKLVYLDPPFNTGQAFDQYDDALQHSVWLTMMRDRLLLVCELLAPDGSVWVHLDDSEMAYCRVLMDEIFGRNAFVASIVWQKRYSRDNRPAIGDVHDYILVYAPLGQDWKHVRNRIPRTAAKEYRNPNNDPRGSWRAVPMTAQGYRPNQMYAITTPAGAVHRPPKGRCWSMLQPRYEELLAAGRIYFGLDGRAQPGVIRYLDEDEGLVPWTWWPHDEVGHNDESKKEMLELFADAEAFATPKPERLLRRIVHIGSHPGDVVLDCFAGSGTTAAVAHKMGRRWIAVERSASTVSTFTRPRLEKVVSGADRGGITDAVGWERGGGFRVLEVGPTVHELQDS